MKLEDQVCSLALAKRLRDLGVKQEGSAFDWYCLVGGLVVDTEVRGEWIVRSESERSRGFGARLAAFTVAELGVMLPSGFASGRPFLKAKFECFPIFDAAPDGELLEAQLRFEKVPLDQEATQADVMAKMLIYLLENMRITVEEVNARMETE